MPTAHVVVESDKGYAQRIRAGHHQLTADEPAKAGGTDTGPSPYGLVLAGLGACTAITLRMYAERKGWDLGRTEVELRAEPQDDVMHISRQIRFSGTLNDEQREKLLEIAEKTPVTRSIRAGMPIATKLA
jgi:putative redox protein